MKASAVMQQNILRVWKRAETAGGREQADGRMASLARESALLPPAFVHFLESHLPDLP